MENMQLVFEFPWNNCFIRRDTFSNVFVRLRRRLFILSMRKLHSWRSSRVQSSRESNGGFPTFRRPRCTENVVINRKCHELETPSFFFCFKRYKNVFGVTQWQMEFFRTRGVLPEPNMELRAISVGRPSASCIMQKKKSWWNFDFGRLYRSFFSEWKDAEKRRAVSGCCHGYVGIDAH